MEPFRIIPTRRRLRSSKMTLEVDEKGDQPGILGEKPKVPSPHPDSSTLAKEMEEFEKLMQLNSTASEKTGSSGAQAMQIKTKGGSSSQSDKVPVILSHSESYKPDQPAKAPDIPYEPDKPTDTPDTPYDPDEPTDTPAVLFNSAKSPVLPCFPKQPTTQVPYDPEKPTATGCEEYVPEEPTPLQEKVDEPYEPEQPTDEMEFEDIEKATKIKRAVSEVEADMPQLTLDSDKCGQHIKKDAAGLAECVKIEEESMSASNTAEKVADTSTSVGSVRTEQENLIPEVWLRKREKKKKTSSHSKHKKPLVEWRLGVIRKDYVRKDLTKFPVDEKLMATTKHKWNNESEVEHLKVHSLVDSDFTDTSEVSGIASPAYLTCDTEPETEQEAETEAEMETNQITISTVPTCNSDIDQKPLHDDTLASGKGEQDSKGDDAVSSARTDEIETNTETGVEKIKSENKGMDEDEKEETPHRMNTRRSSRRSKVASEDKVETDPKNPTKDETRRRSLRSDRHRDEADETEDKKEKKDCKEEMKDQSKLETKDQSKLETRDQSKLETRDQSKLETRDQSKSDTCEKEPERRRSLRSEKSRNDSDEERKTDRKEKSKESDSKVDEESRKRRSRRSERYTGGSDEEKSEKSRDFDPKKDDSRRISRRSTRYRDDSDDEKKEMNRNSDTKRDDSRRRTSRRSEKYREDSDDRRDSRDNRRRSRSSSRERRRRRDDDKYDRYDRDSRRDRRSDRSRERSEDRRYREDEKRHNRTVSRERDDRKSTRRGRSDEEDRGKDSKISESEKSGSKQLKEDKNVKEKDGGKDAPSEKDQSSQSDNDSKSVIRMPIKFNFTSRRNTRSSVKPKVGVFDDENEEDDKPIAELFDLREEKVKESVKSESAHSLDNSIRVTRSRSKEGAQIDDKGVCPTLQSEVQSSGAISKADASGEITLRKELRKDVNESESDSGAEFGLMNFNDDAPRLYPETILHSQLEMEILASAFCSTDTEPDTEMERRSDTEKADEENICNSESSQDSREDGDKAFSRNTDANLMEEHCRTDTNVSLEATDALVLTETICEVPQRNKTDYSPIKEVEPTLVTLFSTEKSTDILSEEKEVNESGILQSVVCEDLAVTDHIDEEASSEHVCENDDGSDMNISSPPNEDMQIDTNEFLPAPVSPKKRNEDDQSLVAETQCGRNADIFTYPMPSSSEAVTDSNTDTEASVDILPSEDERESDRDYMSVQLPEQKGYIAAPGVLELAQRQDDFSSDLEENLVEEGRNSNRESDSEGLPGVEIIDLIECTASTVASSISLIVPSESSEAHIEAKTESFINTVQEPIKEERLPAFSADKDASSTMDNANQTSTIQQVERSSRRKESRWGDTEQKETPPAVPPLIEGLPDTTMVEVPHIEQLKPAPNHEKALQNNLQEVQVLSSDIQNTELCLITAMSERHQENVDAQDKTKPSAVVEGVSGVESGTKPPAKRKRKSRWAPVEPEEMLNSAPVIELSEKAQGAVEHMSPVYSIPTNDTAFVEEEKPVNFLKETTPVVESHKQVDELIGAGSIGQGECQLSVTNELIVPPLPTQESCSLPSKRMKVDQAVTEPSAGDIDDDNREPDAGTDFNSQESFASCVTESSSVAEQLSPALSIEMDGAGDNKAGASPIDADVAQGFPKDRREEQYAVSEETEGSLVPEDIKTEMKSGEESMEEGELLSEPKPKEEEEDGSGKELGEIEDDSCEGTETQHRSRRHLSQNKDLPLEEAEKPKESRESREQRRRVQYEEWGIVERSKIPKFVELDENYYLTERRRSKAGKEARRMVCCCTTSREERRQGIKACGEDCLNRVLMIECGSRCPCGDYCTNKRFQRREYSRVGVFYAKDKGHGLKAKEDLKDNSFVMEYVGEVLNPSEFRQRAKQYSKGKNLHFYFMALKSDEIIDATEKGNQSRFMNHSCDPNCETQKWTVNGQLRVGFFTRRAVKAGTELTFDYQFEVYGQEAQKCLCGAEKCRGVIGKQKKQREGKEATPKRRGSVGDRRRKDSFEDVTLDDEIQQMVDELDECGLQSNDHTILLLRFMVRADQQKQRLALLKLIKETTDSTYLKYFLTHHGLRLLWSWMVDLGENPQNLQLQILLALSHLPIPNKNVLEDSKVLSVIERWSRDSAKETEQERAASLRNESDVDSSSASETPSRSDTPVLSAMMASFSIDALKSIVEATSSGSDLDSSAAPGKQVSSSGSLEVADSPSSVDNGDADLCEKPSSSAGEDTRTSPIEDDDSSRQPDSASSVTTMSPEDADADDVKTAAGNEGISEAKDSAIADEGNKSEVASGEVDVPVSSASGISHVDSTAILEGEIKDDSEKSAKNGCEDMSSEAMGAVDQVQSSEILTEGTSPSDMATDKPETESKMLSELDDRTSSSEQTYNASEALVNKEHNNEAESKDDGESKNDSSGLGNIISSLLESWSDLKEIYRIPKKESDKDKDKNRDRDHDRDRHRHEDRERDRRHDRDRDRHRERDRGSDRSRDRDDKHRSRAGDRDRDRHRDGDRERDKDRERDRKDRDKDDRSRRKRSRSRSREREMKLSAWSQDSEATSTPPKLRKPWKDTKGKETKEKGKEGAEKEGKKLSKEERRALFELEVEAKEREEAARKEQELLMMAQWEEREQAQREQMSQYLEANGFPMDPNVQGMMMNEHGMPIEVLPAHMGMGIGGMPMGEEYMGHPDMHGQYPEHMQHPDIQGHYPTHMQHPDHMGMEGAYPHPHMHEHMIQTHSEAPAMYDDRGFPIPHPEHIAHGGLSMPPNEMQHPGMEYVMHPEVDPNTMGEQMHPGVMSQHPNVDPHLLGGQAHPGNPSVLPPDHLIQDDMDPQQSVVVQQAQPAPSEEELMPPPSLPAPKKTKAQKSQQKVVKEAPVSSYVAPAPASNRSSPVLPQSTTASSVPAVQPQAYPAQQASQGAVPVAQAPPVMQPPVLPQHPQQAAQTTFTFVTPDGMLVTQTITPLAATEPAINPHVQQIQQHAQMGGGQQQQQQQPQVSESIPSPPAKPKTSKLPPKWKTAQDAEGKTYYYHSVTRQTQWEPPVWDEEVDGPFVDDSQGSGSNTPTYDEKSKQRTTTAPADTSSEAAKKLKEAFRSKMSHHVVGYLNVYRKPECKLGRITNTEDFKHLARKLTHGIMAKELKHCRNIEDLEVNENVKHKAKEYIKKYMARFGKIYKKDTVEIDF